MGIYAIPCKQCGKIFLWFSGNLDQRCADCKKMDAEVKTLRDPSQLQNSSEQKP